MNLVRVRSPILYFFNKSYDGFRVYRQSYSKVQHFQMFQAFQHLQSGRTGCFSSNAHFMCFVSPRDKTKNPR